MGGRTILSEPKFLGYMDQDPIFLPAWCSATRTRELLYQLKAVKAEKLRQLLILLYTCSLFSFYFIPLFLKNSKYSQVGTSLFSGDSSWKVSAEVTFKNDIKFAPNQKNFLETELIYARIIRMRDTRVSPLILFKEAYRWFAVTWWDGHVGGQNNSKLWLVFCIIIESNSQKTFSLLFCTPTWPRWRQVKTIYSPIKLILTALTLVVFGWTGV